MDLSSLGAFTLKERIKKRQNVVWRQKQRTRALPQRSLVTTPEIPIRPRWALVQKQTPFSKRGRQNIKTANSQMKGARRSITLNTYHIRHFLHHLFRRIGRLEIEAVPQLSEERNVRVHRNIGISGLDIV